MPDEEKHTPGPWQTEANHVKGGRTYIPISRGTAGSRVPTACRKTPTRSGASPSTSTDLSILSPHPAPT